MWTMRVSVGSASRRRGSGCAEGEAGRYGPHTPPRSRNAKRGGLIHDGLYVTLLECGEWRAYEAGSAYPGTPT